VPDPSQAREHRFRIESCVEVRVKKKNPDGFFFFLIEPHRIRLLIFARLALSLQAASFAIGTYVPSGRLPIGIVLTACSRCAVNRPGILCLALASLGALSRIESCVEIRVKKKNPDGFFFFLFEPHRIRTCDPRLKSIFGGLNPY